MVALSFTVKFIIDSRSGDPEPRGAGAFACAFVVAFAFEEGLARGGVALVGVDEEALGFFALLAELFCGALVVVV